MEATCISSIDLGPAWAGNSVNTAIYRQGLCSRGGYQYATFYTAAKELVAVQRKLANNKISQYVIDTVASLEDAHLTSSIGVDTTGRVHLSYHHHNTPLNYRRMGKPHDLKSFGPLEGMTACFEKKVCYPFFLHPAGKGDAFYFIYRNGYSGNGEIRLKRYDSKLQRWWDDELPLMSGMLGQPWKSNPYLQTPVMDAKGHLHLFATWRTHSLGEKNRVNNINLDYMWGAPDARYWQSSRRQPMHRPVTQVNSETAAAIPPGSNMMNQSGATVDCKGAPIAVFYADDAQGIPQYQIVRLRDGVWQRATISARKESFALEGGGTLQVPISRPEVVVLPDNRPLVLYRADSTQQRIVAVALNEATLAPEGEFILSEPVGFAEPVIDRARWQTDGILTLFVQHNEQPPGEGKPHETTSPVTLKDWKFG